MACSRSGGILSVYGNSVDYPVETIGKVEPDRPLEQTL
jgi:hypothetical protein